jgi:dihydrofolate reductase
MRKLIASTFTSLDGVMQAPGGPEEDLTGNFTMGGWTFAFGDEMADLSAAGFDGNNRELVLGRKTYEIFASYWPHQSEDNPIAKIFNATKKHVASRTLKSLEWNNSSLLGDNIISAITVLKSQPGKNLQIIGSGNLIQTLQTASLIDEYHVWTYPVVLGGGKRLFENGVKPGALRLVTSKVSASGVLMSTYVPAGEIQLGTVG